MTLWSRPLTVHISLGVLLANVLVYLLTGVALYENWLQYDRGITLSTQNLSRTLELVVAGTIDKADAHLRTVAYEAERMLALGKVDAAALNNTIKQQYAMFPEVDGVRVTDADGYVRYGAAKRETGPTLIDDRDYFKTLRDSPGTGLILSQPLISRLTGKWSLSIARRLNLPGGEFGGIAYVVLPLDYFMTVVSSIDVGEHGAVAIRNLQHAMLARYPATDVKNRHLGDTALGVKSLAMLSTYPESGTYTTVYNHDGLERTLSYRKVGIYPIYVFVGLSTDDYFAPWRKELTVACGFAALFSIVTVYFAWSAIRRRREEMLFVGELKESKEQLGRSEAKYRTIYLATNDAILLSDERGSLLDCNPAALVLFGCKEEAQLLAKQLGELSLPTQPDGLATDSLIGRAYVEARHEGSSRFELTHRRCDSDERRVAEVVMTAFELDGRTVFQSLVRDTTEKKRTEAELELYRLSLEDLVAKRTKQLAEALTAAEEANRAKSLFLSNMSHELRTPLNAVIGFSRLMVKSSHMDETEKKNLEIINRSGSHLLTLINDILELSKIEVGHVELIEEATHVGALVTEVGDMLRTRAQQADLYLDVRQEGDIPAVQADITKLRQVLVNLVGNAVKFTRRGGVILSLRGVVEEDSTVRLTFAVRDTGIGIAQEELQRIFEPFTQLNTHAITVGTGLGLTITQNYLRLMRSELNVTSVPGEGSCFSFTLNLPQAESPVAIQVVPKGMVVGLVEQDKNKRILIAEDNAEARYLLKSMLLPLGFIVAEAQDGLEAISLAKSFEPNLILMDWRMPKLDGLEASRKIREQVAGPSPRIIMLTANAFEEDRQTALLAGIDDFLRKPLQEDQLYSALERQLAIRFLREDELTPAAKVQAVAVTLQSLAALPIAQREALRQAIEELNRSKLAKLLNEIALIQPQLAKGLTQMADAFQFREIWELVDAAKQDT